jgi:thiol-disulfide isomerase/thioredoxin
LKTVAASGCALAIFVAASLPLRAANAAELQPWNDGRQPSFTLPDTDGAGVPLDTARGHVVLVHFFATWCAPCREELPALNRLAERANGSVKVLAISVAEVDLWVRRFIQTVPVNFPIMLDRDRAVAKAWKVSTLPTTFVLDANLRPRLVVETDYAWDRVDPAKLADMLAIDAREPAAATVKTTANPRQGGG